MTSANQEKIFSKEWFYAYTLLIVGSFLYAVGDVMFVNPYLLAPGGSYVVYPISLGGAWMQHFVQEHFQYGMPFYAAQENHS